MQITTTKTQPSQNITIIKETQFSHKPAIQNKIDFVTPPFISKPYKSTTPDPIDTSTPTINENQSKQNPSKEILTPKTYKKRKTVKQETIHNIGLKVTQKLAKLNYRDTGFLSNTTDEERQRTIALSMFYQLGKFDPSNQFICNYRGKNIIHLVKHHTIKKTHKINALTEIHIDIHTFEECMEQNKVNKYKTKNETKK